MSIFKSTFKPYVANQITARQDLVNYSHGNRPIEFNLYTSGKAAWSRMVSLVDYDSPDGKYKGQDLSRKYILQGGALYNKTNKNNPTLDEYVLRSGVGYKDGSYGGNLGNRDYGLRPMPGISEITLKSKTAYGSLREAVVEFYAWDKKQLDELEILFMRTGYWVLLEWGWSMYLDTSKYRSVNDIIGKGLKQFNQPTINPFQESINQEAIYEQLEVLKEKFSGNYDGILGLVRNFSWSMLPNGGFKCNITIISVGDVLDSIKVNSGNPEKLFSNGETPVKTYFELFLDKLISNQGDDVFEDVVSDIVNIPDIRRSIYTLPFEKSKKTGGIHYIQFGYFIALLNKKVNFFSKDKRLFKLEIPLPHKNSLGNSYCLASEDTVSVDPEVCIIRNTKAKFICDNSEGFNITKNVPGVSDDYIPDYIRNGFGIIGNVFLSLEYAKSVYQQMLTDTKGDVHLAKYIKNILSGISEALGSVNDFDIFANDNTGVIIDKHYCEPDTDSKYNNKFRLNILGTNSVVRDAKIESKIFPSQATMVAIAAGDRENLGSIQSSTNVAMNKGLKSRVFQQLSESENESIKYDKENEEKEKVRFISSIIDLRSYVIEYILNRKLPDDNSLKSSASSLLNSLILRVNNDTNYKAIIPITLEFKLDGISGITIGEIFTINADILPKEYQDKRIGFIVTGLGANLSRNDWTTTITAMVCLLDQDELKKSRVNIQKLKQDFKLALSQQETQQRIAARESIMYYNLLVAITSDYYSKSFMSIKSLSATNSRGTYMPRSGYLALPNLDPDNLTEVVGATNNFGLNLPGVHVLPNSPLTSTTKKAFIDYYLFNNIKSDVKISNTNGSKKLPMIEILKSQEGSNSYFPSKESILNELSTAVAVPVNNTDGLGNDYYLSYDEYRITPYQLVDNTTGIKDDFNRQYLFLSRMLKATYYYKQMIPSVKNYFDEIFDKAFKKEAIKGTFDFDFRIFKTDAASFYGKIDFDKMYNLKITNIVTKPQGVSNREIGLVGVK